MRWPSVLLLLVHVAHADLVSDGEELLRLFAATNGNLTWGEHTPGWTLGTDPCNVYDPVRKQNSSWKFVECSETPQIHVANVTIQDNGLTGTLPRNLHIASLRVLDLSFNDISGTIPSNWTASLPSLEYLQTHDNSLSGSIPDEVWDMATLRVLDLSGNHVSGNLSTYSCRLDMEVLSVANNKISGVIPACSGAWASLQHLDLSNNFLSGTLPFSIKDQTELQSLILSNNKLSGPIPRVFSATPFSNAAPPLAKIKRLVLSENMFDGLLPPLFNYLCHPECRPASTLEELDLSNLPLDGQDLKSLMESIIIPGEGCLCEFFGGKYTAPSLRILDVSDSNVTGSLLNDVFTLFPSLVALSISGNSLSGTLPHAFRSGLTLLDLSKNSLVGVVPENYHENLPNAMQINLLNNQLGDHDEMLPSFLQADLRQESLTVELGHFICPGVRDRTSRNTAWRIDSAYFAYVLCNCSQHFFGANGTCVPVTSVCLQKYTCGSSSEVRNDFQINAGYWPAPSAHNATLIIPCQVQDSSGLNYHCNPYGNVTCVARRPIIAADGTDTFAFSCSGTVCAPGFEGRLCSKCAEGFYKRGRTCDRCIDPPPWIKPLVLATFAVIFVTAVVLTVLQCSSMWILGLFPMTVLSGIMLLKMGSLWTAEIVLFFFMAQLVSTAPSRQQGQKTPRNFITSTATILAGEVYVLVKCLLKSFLLYIQTTEVVVRDAIVWPPLLADLQIKLEFINFQISGLECMLPSQLGGFLVYMALPVAFFVVLLLCFGLAYVQLTIRHAIWRRWPHRGQEVNVKAALVELTRYLLRIFCFLLYTVYFEVTNRVLAVLRCVRDPASGELYMQTTPWVLCTLSPAPDDTDPWLPMFFIALVCLVFYVIGIPVAFSWLLWRHRARMNDMPEKNVAHTPASAGATYGAPLDPRDRPSVAIMSFADVGADDLEISLLSFLIVTYHPQRWWYEGVFLARRLSVSLLVSLVRSDSVMLVISLLAVLQTSILVHVVVWPYRGFTANILELASLLVIMFSFLGSMALSDDFASFYQNNSTRQAEFETLQVLLFVANIGVIVAFLACLADAILRPLFKIVLRSLRKSPHEPIVVVGRINGAEDSAALLGRTRQASVSDEAYVGPPRSSIDIMQRAQSLDQWHPSTPEHSAPVVTDTDNLDYF